jgi:hypothetical protein
LGITYESRDRSKDQILEFAKTATPVKSFVPVENETKGKWNDNSELLDHRSFNLQTVEENKKGKWVVAL